MKKIAFGLFTFFLPVLALAQPYTSLGASGRGGLFEFLDTILTLLNTLIPLIIAIAFLYFLWALALYMFKIGEEQDEARDHMIWGLVTLFVMVAAWGLVNVLASTFGFSIGDSLDNSQIPYIGR